MAKKPRNRSRKLPESPEPLPPLLFPPEDRSQEAWLTGLRKAGRIRKIGPRLYTSVPPGEEQGAVRQGWMNLVSRLFPEALLSHRSALEYRPTERGQLFLTSSTHRKIEYPGLTLIFVRGPVALPDDPPVAGFRASSQARAFLENLSSSKNTAERSLSLHVLEARLEKILEVNGEDRLNALRDRAREIAGELNWQPEFHKLDGIIGALMGTRTADQLRSSAARARVRGKPFDHGRISLFNTLYSELRAEPLPVRHEKFTEAEHVRNKAFFDAYFSNYIEGTTFEVEEAEEIIFEGRIPEKRPKDGHDISSTYAIVSDPNVMRETPKSGESFLEILKKRHLVLMSARPDKSPGDFKGKPNRAGDTHFVDPGLVEGTLLEGFSRYLDLPKGLPRAIFIMFLVAEVHPFVDGNGRIARIMMNAELVSEKLSTIIIPNVYRDSYLLALRALTRRSRPETVVKMLAQAQGFSQINFSKYRPVLQYLQEHNWFREPDEATIIF